MFKLSVEIHLLKELEIEEKIEVNIIKINHNFKFFWILFSDFVIKKSGTSIQTIIQKVSFKFRLSQKKNKLINIIKIGLTVL